MSFTRRRIGRPPLFADARPVTIGVPIHPEQAERLHALAERQGVTLAAMLRGVICKWEQETVPGGA